MHEVGDNELLRLDHVEVEILRGSVRPRDEYFDLLDSLCDPVEARGRIQFTSPVGLGRAAVTGAGLAAAFTSHFFWASYHIGAAFTTAEPWPVLVLVWSVYVMCLCVYHSSEFLVTMRYNAPIASCESFLLDQSRQYQLAMAFSWVEFWVEALLFPHWKAAGWCRVLMVAGIILTQIGQFFRTGAMISAKANFTHLIQFKKAKAHRLVTTGLYRIVRHPSYFGWFWWSVGTQLLVANPICLVGFTFAAWKFFHVRIPIEERALTEFFPTEYPAYKARTSIGIPFL